MHHQREGGQQFLDGCDAIEVQPLLAAELVSAVRRADGHGQRIAAAALDELDRLLRIGQAGVLGRDLNVFFDSAQHAQLGFDRDALLVRSLDHALGGGDVFVERLVRGVDHDRRVEAAVDAVVTNLFGAVIEMYGEDRLGKYVLGGADHGFQEPLVGEAPGTARDLDDERGTLAGVDRLLVRVLQPQVAAEQADRLLEVVDVVGPHRVIAVGMLKQFFGRDDHGIFSWRSPRGW